MKTNGTVPFGTVPFVKFALCERLRLQRSVLIRCDGTRVEETFCLSNLSCGTTADLADVLLLRMLDLLSLRLCTRSAMPLPRAMR